jgi:recombination protein RecA
MSKEVSKKEIAPEKLAKLLALTKQLNKDHGDGAVFNGDIKVQGIEFLSTGSVVLDDALGGGFPIGRMVEVMGPEASGKTTLLLHAIANAQRNGKVCAFIDVEHALDIVYAEKLGVDVKALLISQPDYGEQALDMFESMVSSGAVDVIAVDSIAALVPKTEIENGMEDKTMGLQARMMSLFCRKVVALVKANKVLALFTNQEREKIGVMYGPTSTTPGGNAMKYYASQRIRVRASSEKIKDGDRQIGHLMAFKVTKNKVASPFREGEVPVLYGIGFDKSGETYVMAKGLDVLTITGGTHKLGDEKLASNREEMLELLRKDTKLLAKVEELVRKALAAGKRMPAA